MEVIVSVAFNGECRVLKLPESPNFADFIEDIQGRLFELNNIDYICRYSVGPINNCVLDSDRDLNNLISICKLTSENIVHVVVSQVSSPSHLDSNLSFSNVISNVAINCTPCCKSIPKIGVGLDDLNSQNLVEPNKILKQTKIPFRCAKNRRISGGQEEFIGLCSLPSYDINPVTTRKTLLSDQWQHSMDQGIGSVFPDGVVGFRKQLILHASRVGFIFDYLRNDSNYIYVVCGAKVALGCGWFIRARCNKANMSFEIYNDIFVHSCLGRVSCSNRKRLGPKLISELVEQEVRSKPDISGKSVVNLLRINYGVNIQYHSAWRTAQWARDKIFGAFQDSYDNPRWYGDAVKRTNPGSMFDIEVNPLTDRFQRLFVAFDACLKGFKSCRPMLFLDGTFLHGRAKGILLTATAKDGNNGLFPVAFGVVSAENTLNWKWFLTKLRDNCKHEKEIFYISDRNCGLMSAFPLVFDEPLHFFCLFHLLTNLRGKFGGGIRIAKRHRLADIFKECAYAPNVRIFDEKIATFKELGGESAERWLSILPKEKWAVAHSIHITRYGEMTSNAAESLNAWLKEASGYPITLLIDHIRSEVGRWHMERKAASDEWNILLCPIKDSMWEYEQDCSRSWKVVQSSTGKIEVQSSPSVVVDIANKICSCCQWQITGFPCSHAALVLTKFNFPLSDFVDQSFLVTTYRKSYMNVIQPIPETEKFEFTSVSSNKILPPLLRNIPGRPKKNRIPSYGEQGKTPSRKRQAE